MTDQVNIPLLRKAVEWAEAEAAKAPELCEWVQGEWVIPVAAERGRWGFDESDDTPQRRGKAAECGTCFCIAGFVATQVVGPTRDSIADVAAEALGITTGSCGKPGCTCGIRLFDSENTIDDVRRIAEDIAGERL